MFRVLKIGLLLGALFLMVPAASGQVDLRFSPADTTVEAGVPTRLSIICDEVLDLRAIEVYVEFDTTVVASISGGSGTIFSESGFNLFQGFHLSEPNVWHGYCVIMGAGDWVVTPGELLYWEFEGIADGQSPITTVSVGIGLADGTSTDNVNLPPTTITIGNALTGVERLPSPNLNSTCYPNPFNPTTTLSFTLPESHPVHINIYDINGRLVRNLLNENRDQGPHEVVWNGRGDDGRMQASGLYFSRIQAGPYSQVRKMTLAK